MSDTLDALVEIRNQLAVKTARTEQLTKTAFEVARSLYASLPRGYRLAEFFIRLALDSNIDTFGRVVYAEFIMKDVTGLPDVHGKPAAEYKPMLMKAGARGATLLPHGYGSSIGVDAQKTLFRLGLTPDVVNDTMQEYMILLTSGTKTRVGPIRPGATLEEATSFVKHGVQFMGLDARRNLTTRNRERGRLVNEDEPNKALMIDIEDPHSMQELDRYLSEDYMHKLIAWLDEKLSPKVGQGVIPLYFELADEGIPDRTMIEKGMLTGLTGANSPTGWNNFKKQWLYPSIEAYFRKNPPV